MVQECEISAVGHEKAQAVTAAIDTHHKPVVARRQRRQGQNVALNQTIARSQRGRRGVEPVMLGYDRIFRIQQMDKERRIRR